MTESISNTALKNFVDRVEKLEAEKKDLSTDIREVYASAKAAGFDVKIMRKVIAERRKDAAERAEQEALMEVYRHALGM